MTYRWPRSFGDMSFQLLHVRSVAPIDGLAVERLARANGHHRESMLPCQHRPKTPLLPRVGKAGGAKRGPARESRDGRASSVVYSSTSRRRRCWTRGATGSTMCWPSRSQRRLGHRKRQRAVRQDEACEVDESWDCYGLLHATKRAASTVCVVEDQASDVFPGPPFA